MNLYVGNLNFDAQEEDLRILFDEIGEVESVRLMIDKETGRSKGFAFIEMPDTEEAVIAMKTLNGRLFFGREIVVNLAVQEDKPKREGNFDHKRGQGKPFQQNRGGNERFQRPNDKSYPSSDKKPYRDVPKSDFVKKEGDSTGPKEGGRPRIKRERVDAPIYRPKLDE